MSRLGVLVRDRRLNALVGWACLAFLGGVAAETLLGGGVLWGGFVLSLVAVAALPPVTERDWTVMVPWPTLAVAALAVAVRRSGYVPEAAGHVVVTTFALVAVAELTAFTSVKMSPRFAVGFAALTAMAVQSLWAVAQYFSDRWLATAFLRSQTELQWDFVVVTAVTVVLGALFEWYLTMTGDLRPETRSTTRTDG